MKEKASTGIHHLKGHILIAHIEKTIGLNLITIAILFPAKFILAAITKNFYEFAQAFAR